MQPKWTLLENGLCYFSCCPFVQMLTHNADFLCADRKERGYVTAWQEAAG
jgi:hypothetical protein